MRVMFDPQWMADHDYNLYGDGPCKFCGAPVIFWIGPLRDDGSGKNKWILLDCGTEIRHFKTCKKQPRQPDPEREERERLKRLADKARRKDRGKE
jgi:hypothetical protein